MAESTAIVDPPLAAVADPDAAVFRRAVDVAREGVSVCDARQPDYPLVYVNPAFCALTGYPADEILGINCRFLQGDDTLQPELDRLRLALRHGSGCVVTLRNYRRDGKLFYNELSVSPVRDGDGALTHYVGIQKDVTRRVVAEQKLATRERKLRQLQQELSNLSRCDALTGLLNRRTFDECLDQEWRRARRDGVTLNLIVLDLDQFRALNGRYGRAIGDSCLRRVGELLEENFGRASDFVARADADEFLVLTVETDAAQAVERARLLVDALRSLPLPDPVARLTASAGLAAITPGETTSATLLLENARAALDRARTAGCNRLEHAISS